MIDVDKNKFQKIIQEWFAQHNKSLNTLDKTSEIKEFGRNKQRFIITHKFFNYTYWCAIGFNIDKYNKLKCRHFYKSQSESAWRVGTGWRLNGGWAKGAEAFEQLHMPGGYIGEGILQYEFAEYIENLAQTIKTPEDVVLFDIINSIPSANMYLCAAYPRIQDEYGMERLIKFNTLNTLINNSRWKSSPFHKLCQPDLQVTATIKDGNGIHSDHNYASKIKHDDILWNSILPCLKEKPVQTYDFKHDLLNENCAVDIFLLKPNIYIEIAHTKASRNLDFYSNSGLQYTVNSPICWVKSIYVNENATQYDYSGWGILSSFGNYLTYADDLWFLIQKPIEHTRQIIPNRTSKISDIHIKEKLFKGEGDISKCFPILNRSGLRATVKASFNGKIETKIIDDPLKVLYKEKSFILLAWYNEKYSKLIQEYKKLKRYNLFKSKSNRYLSIEIFKSTLKSFIESIKKGNNNTILPGVVDKLLEACAYYKRQSGGIGSTGRLRCTCFEETLNQLKINHTMTHTKIGEILFKLFSYNTIGSQRFSDFLGFGGTIRTKETSLFTICANHLLELPEFIDCFIDFKIPSDKIQTEMKIWFSRLTRNEDCIERFYLKALTLNLLEIRRTNEEQTKILLKALMNKVHT